MTIHRWSDLKRKRLSADALQKIDQEVRDEITEMNLRALREAAGETQSSAAVKAEMTQSELSKIERRDDHLISTLRRYVEGLGGQLEVTAVFNGRRVKLIGV